MRLKQYRPTCPRRVHDRTGVLASGTKECPGIVIATMRGSGVCWYYVGPDGFLRGEAVQWDDGADTVPAMTYSCTEGHELNEAEVTRG